MASTSKAEQIDVNASGDVDHDTDLDISDDYVDPRVQVELEKLNSATDAINKLEVELDEARALFRQRLSESSHRIQGLANKLGNCIEKARPYYEARMKAKDAHAETQKAALRFERANSAHAAAKEMVFLAEEGLQKEGRTFDPAWQEMLNHATMRVNEAERERTFSEQEHKLTSQAYNEAEQRVQYLQKELKRAISKSRPYFEMKAQFCEVLEEQKLQVEQLEEQIFYVKQSYAFALRSLEQISDEIHQRRHIKQQHQALGSRGPGVGAESPVPPVPEKDATNGDDGNNIINTDDAYLRLPPKLGHLNNAISKPASSDYENTQGAKKKVVDHGSQTESSPMRSCHGRKEDVTDERISAWVQESGLRAHSARKATHNGPQGLAAMFLSMHEDSDMSDAESLNSTDVLTDEQIASLMLDKELDEAYQDILVSPQVKESSNLTAPDSILNNIYQLKKTNANDEQCKSQCVVAGSSKIVDENSGINMREKESEGANKKPAILVDVGVETDLVLGDNTLTCIESENEKLMVEKPHEHSVTQKEERLPSTQNLECTHSINKTEDRQSTHLVKSSESKTSVKIPSIKSTSPSTAAASSLCEQSHERIAAVKEPTRLVQNAQPVISQIKNSSRQRAKSESSSHTTKVVAKEAAAESQEIQVVAVQFTVQETRVMPKVERSLSYREESLSACGIQKPQQHQQLPEGMSRKPKSRSFSHGEAD